MLDSCYEEHISSAALSRTLIKTVNCICAICSKSTTLELKICHWRWGLNCRDIRPRLFGFHKEDFELRSDIALWDNFPLRISWQNNENYSDSTSWRYKRIWQTLEFCFSSIFSFFSKITQISYSKLLEKEKKLLNCCQLVALLKEGFNFGNAKIVLRS